MTARRLVVIVVLALAAACARRPPQPVAPVAQDLVVLAPDPGTGEVGGLLVTSGAGQAELTEARASTTVISGQGPGPVTVLDEATVQQTFGAVLALVPDGAERFELYFETGGDTLTAESAAQLPSVIARVRARVAPEVSIIGHTDTTGTAESNVALGLERAGLIRDLLVGDGLDVSLIEVVSHGESDPLVPTPDNTAEGRNRRVEVTIR
ncbi:MAG: OmpA family protein [Vicinamibacterales bacterium]